MTDLLNGSIIKFITAVNITVALVLCSSDALFVMDTFRMTFSFLLYEKGGKKEPRVYQKGVYSAMGQKLTQEHTWGE